MMEKYIIIFKFLKRIHFWKKKIIRFVNVEIEDDGKICNFQNFKKNSFLEKKKLFVLSMWKLTLGNEM